MTKEVNQQLDISIIIVSYNTKNFLKLCLFSVQKAIRNFKSEIIIVDNASTDGTVEMIRNDYPGIHLIANKDNVGFAKANNQAIALSKGKYITLLNPDTIVGEDTFYTIFDYYEHNTNAGGIGVKLIDGSGKFLSESKRGLPTPSTSFYKLTGLARLFPKSKKIAKYYLGHLHNEKAHEIDILPGAFIVFPKKYIPQLNGLNEIFFMYGEDIDFSYRLQQLAGSNHYLGQSSVVHFKGESTPYRPKMIYHFYHSMWLFYKLHFLNKYNAITKFAVKTGVAAAMTFAYISLPLRKALLRKTNLSPSQIIICSDNPSISEEQIKKLYPKVQTIQFTNTARLFESQINLIKGNTQIIFDLKHINIDSAIRFMSNIKKPIFSFLAPDSSFIFSSPYSNKKGLTILLDN